MKSPTKRTLAVFLVGIVAILAFAACSSTDDATDAPAASEPAAPAQAAAPADAAAPSAAQVAVQAAGHGGGACGGSHGGNACGGNAQGRPIDHGGCPLERHRDQRTQAQFIANCLAVPVRLRLPDSAERGNRATDAWSCRVVADRTGWKVHACEDTRGRSLPLRMGRIHVS